MATFRLVASHSETEDEAKFIAGAISIEVSRASSVSLFKSTGFTAPNQLAALFWVSLKNSRILKLNRGGVASSAATNLQLVSC